MLNLFKKNTTASARLAEVGAKISAVQAAQTKRDERRKALQGEAETIAVDLAAGEPIAIARNAEIDIEIAQIEREIGVGARVLAGLGDAQAEARNAVQAEKDAAERESQIRAAKANLKRIPAMFNELKELEARTTALRRELASVEHRAASSFDLDAWQANMTGWLEHRAGMRQRSPDEQATHDARQERYEAERRRKAEMAWQNSPKKEALDAERYAQAGWQVHNARDLRYNSDTREWE